jgi:hypothetical protein
MTTIGEVAPAGFDRGKVVDPVLNHPFDQIL